MKKLLLLFLLLPGIAHAQATAQTTVTGTIVDPVSVPYYPATVTACLAPPATNPTVDGVPVNPNQGANYCIGPVQTSPTGFFTISLFPNASILNTPPNNGTTQWQFMVVSAGSAPPAGKGPQTFYLTITINSGTQNISTQLNANAPLQLNSGGGGGNGNVVGTGTANNVTCWMNSGAIFNCPDLTDPSGAPVIAAPLKIVSGSGPTGISLQEGAPANCATPTAGLQILCSINSPDSLVLSSNGGAYGAIGGGSGTVSPGTAGDLLCYNTTGSTGSACPDITDSGGIVTITDDIQVSGDAIIANEGRWDYTYIAGATLANGQLVKFNGTQSQIIPATTSDTTGIVGVTLGITGTVPSGTQVLVNRYGNGSVLLDNAGSCTAQEPIINSTTTAGDGHCTASPGTAQVVGTYFNFSGGSDIDIYPIVDIAAPTGGSLTGLTTNGMIYATSATAAASVTPPATNGLYNCGYTVTASTVVTPTCPQVGLGGRSITGSTTTDPIASSDNATTIDHDVAGTGSNNETLPTATTLGNPAFVFRYTNHSAQTDTITPTTWTIQSGTAAAGASLSVPPGAFVTIKVDPNSATNWLADCTACSGASFTSLTLTANGAASAPSFNVTGIPFAGTATNSSPLAFIACNGATVPTTFGTGGTSFGINTCTGQTYAMAVWNNGGGPTYTLSPAGAIVAASLSATSSITSGATITAASGSAFAFNGSSGMRAATNGRIRLGNNADTTNGLVRLTFGTEAAANPAFVFDGSTAAIKTADGTGATTAGIFSSAVYKTDTNCAGVGTAASPSVVTCTGAAAGAFSCATNATGATCVINTTAVTANSEIFVQQVVDEGTRLGVTCNTASVLPAGPLLAAKSAGTAFTINLGTVSTNPGCFDYHIVN